MIRGHFFAAIGVAAALALALALAGCGQKGPLKLPEPPKPAEPAK
jgi:predicted small lipoprotein YifL